jgi:hypothetical protein
VIHENQEAHRTRETPNCMQPTPPVEQMLRFKRRPVKAGVEQALVRRQNYEQRERDHDAEQQTTHEHLGSSPLDPSYGRDDEACGGERGLHDGRAPVARAELRGRDGGTALEAGWVLDEGDVKRRPREQPRADDGD